MDVRKLKPEDIGLEQKNLSDQLISLGHKRLLPKDALATLAVIEGRAHALVEANTFPFLNGLGHFLPNSKLAEVTEKLEELEPSSGRRRKRSWKSMPRCANPLPKNGGRWPRSW